MSTCFIVYPLPSIADEGFLRAVFQDKVSRSLFAGFGPRRFAIAELSDADFARRVKEVLQAPHAVCTEAAANEEGNDDKVEVTTESKKAKSTRTSAKKPRSAAKVQDWLNTIPAEEMTLATLFAPPIEESARLRPILAAPNNNPHEEHQQDTSKDDEAAHTSDVNDSLASLAYLHTLLWRGRPVRVVCSPVTVDEFYRSGGVVPEKQSKSAKQINNKDTREHKPMNAHVQRNKKREHAEATPDDNNAANVTLHEEEKGHDGMAARKRSRTEGAANAHHTPREPVKSSPATQADAKHATRPTFPKDCCQKCGSKAHFTRHCDNSGLAEHEAAKKEVEDEMVAVKQEKLIKPERVVTAADVTPVKTAPKTVVRTSKDQCKYCGSNDHLSRHCPNK